jgi:beta propeller repeat protein
MKVNKRTAVCFGILLVIFLMTIGNATAVPAEGTRTRVISSDAHPKSLDIYGDRIVWADDRNEEGQVDNLSLYSNHDENWDIYMYDLSTSMETQITSNNSTQSNPSIYENRIVWQDLRNGNWDIYMYDLSTSMETRITTNESNQTLPAIYDDKIVWQDDRNGNLNVYMYNLSTSTETQITINESNQSEPAIYGDKIVWVDEVQIDNAVDPYFSINNNICVYDLATSTETRLPSGLRIWNPSIYKDVVVWGQEDFVGNNEMIIMYNLSTSTGDLIAYERTGSPDIYEDRIVWTQDFWDFRDHVLMYNISTSTETELTAEGVHEAGSGSYPAIYGDRIIWVPSRLSENASSSIYIFTLDSAGSPVDNRENGTETQITTNGSFQIDPSIYGNQIVWQDARNGKGIGQSGYPAGGYDIYMYDLSAHKEIQITNDSSDKVSSDIYGDRIVWNEWRNGNPEVYTYNISTSNKTKIHDDVINNPRVYKDRIVWAINNIYMYNLSTSTEVQISNNTSYQDYPAIYGDNIVWTDSRDGNLDIYMYNLSTSTETQITTNNSIQRVPDIYEDRIVWEDDRNGNWDIYMYNLSTSTETQITTNEFNQGSPSIYGDRIVWVDDRSGRPDVYMYNLSTSKETRITTSGSVWIFAGDDDAWGGIPGILDIYGDRIVWHDSRNGNPDIYMFTLASAEVPPLDDNCTDDERDENGTQPSDNCSSELTPLGRIQALKEYIESTYRCHVNTKTGLADLLDTSKCYYEKGENTESVSVLNSFINLVEKMKLCEQVSADEADYMVRKANEIIDQIEVN